MATGTEQRRIFVDGEAVLEYLPFEQQQPTADDARALAPLDRVVPAVLEQLAGHWLSTEDDRLTDALLGAGATMVRHSHLYSLDLSTSLPTSLPQDGTGSGTGRFQIGGIDSSAHDLAELSILAYPPGHTDHETVEASEAAVDLAKLLDGSMVGPYLAAPSGQVIHDGRIVAVCIINRMGGTPPAGGPWVSEVFRDPDLRYRGLGAMLIQRAVTVLSCDDEGSLSLVVTEGNAAEAVYRRLAFRKVWSRRKILIPVLST